MLLKLCVRNIVHVRTPLGQVTLNAIALVFCPVIIGEVIVQEVKNSTVILKEYPVKLPLPDIIRAKTDLVSEKALVDLTHLELRLG